LPGGAAAHVPRPVLPVGRPGHGITAVIASIHWSRVPWVGLSLSRGGGRGSVCANFMNPLLHLFDKKIPRRRQFFSLGMMLGARSSLAFGLLFGLKPLIPRAESRLPGPTRVPSHWVPLPSAPWISSIWCPGPAALPVLCPAHRGPSPIVGVFPITPSTCVCPRGNTYDDPPKAQNHGPPPTL